MMKTIISLLILLFCCADAEAQSPTQLGNFPQRTLAQIAGVDSSKNVGLSPVAALPCAIPNGINPPLYYTAVAFGIGCSTQVQITDTTLSVLNFGTISFPDGSRITNQGPSFNGPFVINYNGLYFDTISTPSLLVNDDTLGLSGPGNPANFGCPNLGANSCVVGFGVIGGNNGTGFNLSFNWSGAEFSSNACIQFGNTACQVTFFPNGGIVALGSIQAGGPIFLKTYTVATLPSGNSGLIEQAAISDNNTTCTAGGTPAGGGSTYCIVVSKNGGAWQVLF